jgi:hypothetical protein
MRRFLVPSLLLILGAPIPASAQLMLPGALPQQPGPSAPSGAPVKHATKSTTEAPASAPPARAPSEDTIVDRQFLRNGSNGVMAFERSDGALRLGRLALVGYQISKPAEICRVEIGGGKINLTAAPRRDGLLSYDADIDACPFSIDVLDGAARVRGKVCDFVAADCRVDPTGVWGPPGNSIGPEEAKTIERLRAKAELDARATFRVLLKDAKGDKARIKQIAGEQAGFSSLREETCRDYAQEDKHGFCASRVTLAHVVALSTELHGAATQTAEKAPVKKRAPRRKPPIALAPPPTIQ